MQCKYSCGFIVVWLVRHEGCFLPVEIATLTSSRQNRAVHCGTEGMQEVFWEWQQLHGDVSLYIQW